MIIKGATYARKVPGEKKQTVLDAEPFERHFDAKLDAINALTAMSRNGYGIVIYEIFSCDD